MTDTISVTAASLVKLDKDSKVFEIQGMRILRTLIPELASIKGVVGAPMFISIANVLKTEFEYSIKRNNKKIVELNTEVNKMTKLDLASYQDKITANLSNVTTLEAANDNVRSQLKKVDESISIAKSGNLELAPLYSRINYVFKLRVALRKIAKNYDELCWLIQDIITSPEELQEYLSKNNINEQESMATNVSKVLIDDLEVFKSQIHKLKDFIRELDPTVYAQIESVDELDLKDIGNVISFVRNFDTFYKKVRNTDDFLKVEGITEELALSMSSILSLSPIVAPFNSTDTVTSVDMIQKMVDENIKQNAVKVNLTYHLVKGYIFDLYELNKDELQLKSDLDRLITFTLLSAYHLLDISAGAATLNLLTKVHI